MKSHRASSTARLIAAATILRDQQAGSDGKPPAGAAIWCRRFLSGRMGDRFLVWTVSSEFGRCCWRLIESMALPGIESHWMRRKREIDRLARAAAFDGFIRLIVLGGGLDSLAFRMHEQHVLKHVLLADYPATLGVIRARSAAVCNGVELLPVDLVREDVSELLAAAGEEADTLIVIEGVLMYLPEMVVMHLLRSLLDLSTRRIRLVASWMLAEPNRPIGFYSQSSLITHWLSYKSEPMLWASTPNFLGSTLAEMGWMNIRLIDLAVTDGDSAALSSERLMVADSVFRS